MFKKAIQEQEELIQHQTTPKRAEQFLIFCVSRLNLQQQEERDTNGSDADVYIQPWLFGQTETIQQQARVVPALAQQQLAPSNVPPPPPQNTRKPTVTQQTTAQDNNLGPLNVTQQSQQQQQLAQPNVTPPQQPQESRRKVGRRKLVDGNGLKFLIDEYSTNQKPNSKEIGVITKIVNEISRTRTSKIQVYNWFKNRRCRVNPPDQQQQQQQPSQLIVLTPQQQLKQRNSIPDLVEQYQLCCRIRESSSQNPTPYLRKLPEKTKAKI